MIRRHRQLRQILIPQFATVRAQMIKIFPGINPAVVAVAESRSDGVIAHRAQFGDAYVFLADLQGFLAGSVPPDLGGGRVDPQEFAGQLEARAVLEGDFEDAGFLMQLDIGGDDWVVH